MEPEETSLAFVALEGEDWKLDYMCDRIFRNVYNKAKAAECKSYNRYWINSTAPLHYHTHNGDCIYLVEGGFLQAFQTVQDSLGHFGCNIYNILANICYRPKLSNAVHDFADHCPSFRINKTSHLRPAGLLGQIDTPTLAYTAWEIINVDFILDLPISGGIDVILTIVDRFTNGAIFIPTTRNISACTITDTYFDHRPIQRGILPLKFIMDRNSPLIKEFWKALCAYLKIDYRKTAVYHA